MPIPTSYDAVLLAQFMIDVAPRQAIDLGYSVALSEDDDSGGSFAEEINTVALQMGASDLAIVPFARIHELRLRARVAVLRKITTDYINTYDVGGLAQTLARGQLFSHAKAMLEDAELQLADLLDDQETENGGPGRGVTPSSNVDTNVVWALRTGYYGRK